jgi:uncharacterized membrane protein
MRSKEKPSKETLEKWHKDPNNWKWGMFYFNKEDHRILPPKRIEWMGWTVNFANPRSVIAFLIAIAFFILAVTLIEPKK